MDDLFLSYRKSNTFCSAVERCPQALGQNSDEGFQQLLLEKSVLIIGVNVTFSRFNATAFSDQNSELCDRPSCYCMHLCESFENNDFFFLLCHLMYKF